MKNKIYKLFLNLVLSFSLFGCTEKFNLTPKYTKNIILKDKSDNFSFNIKHLPVASEYLHFEISVQGFSTKIKSTFPLNFETASNPPIEASLIKIPFGRKASILVQAKRRVENPKNFPYFYDEQILAEAKKDFQIETDRVNKILDNGEIDYKQTLLDIELVAVTGVPRVIPPDTSSVDISSTNNNSQSSSSSSNSTTTNLNLSVNVKETNKITSKPIKEANIPTSTEIPKEVKPTFSTNNEVLFKQGSKPTVSPDGNKIVYFDNFDMYISNISGTNTKVLKSDVRWTKASISPDGKVAFIDNIDGKNPDTSRGIYTINQDGSGLKKIIEDESIESTSLSWSPDGKKIAFSKVKNGQSDIFTVDTDGNNEQNITNDVHIDIAPSYSPSGEYIAYISQRKNQNPTEILNNDIYIMNADGSNKFNLTGTDKKIDIIDRPSEPSWSNDSNLILFSSTSKDSNSGYIYITNFHTLYLTKLTNVGKEVSPFMIPFDKKIGYVRAGKIYFSNFSN